MRRQNFHISFLAKIYFKNPYKCLFFGGRSRVFRYHPPRIAAQYPFNASPTSAISVPRLVIVLTDALHRSGVGALSPSIPRQSSTSAKQKLFIILYIEVQKFKLSSPSFFFTPFILQLFSNSKQFLTINVYRFDGLTNYYQENRLHIEVSFSFPCTSVFLKHSFSLFADSVGKIFLYFFAFRLQNMKKYVIMNRNYNIMRSWAHP